MKIISYRNTNTIIIDFETMPFNGKFSPEVERHLKETNYTELTLKNVFDTSDPKKFEFLSWLQSIKTVNLVKCTFYAKEIFALFKDHQIESLNIVDAYSDLSIYLRAHQYWQSLKEYIEKLAQFITTHQSLRSFSFYCQFSNGYNFLDESNFKVLAKALVSPHINSIRLSHNLLEKALVTRLLVQIEQQENNIRILDLNPNYPQHFLDLILPGRSCVKQCLDDQVVKDIISLIDRKKLSSIEQINLLPNGLSPEKLNLLEKKIQKVKSEISSLPFHAFSSILNDNDSRLPVEIAEYIVKLGLFSLIRHHRSEQQLLTLTNDIVAKAQSRGLRDNGGAVKRSMPTADECSIDDKDFSDKVNISNTRRQ